MYKVMLLNDDTTPFDFVVEMLRKHFNMPQARSVAVMMAAHTQDRALVAVYAKDIAEEKVGAANKESRATENPAFGGPMALTFACEPE